MLPLILSATTVLNSMAQLFGEAKTAQAPNHTDRFEKVLQMEKHAMLGSATTEESGQMHKLIERMQGAYVEIMDDKGNVERGKVEGISLHGSKGYIEINGKLCEMNRLLRIFPNYGMQTNLSGEKS
jgi:hypothetical protein